jgi:hypothetical protein
MTTSIARRVSEAFKVDLAAVGLRFLDAKAAAASPSWRRTNRWLGRIAVTFGILLVVGPLLTQRTVLSDMVDGTRGGSTFFIQYQRHEPVFLALMAAFAVAVVLLARRSADQPDISGSDVARVTARSVWRVTGLAAVVFALALVGTSAVMHRFPLAMDEYVAEFQARIFAAGQLTVPVPSEWQQFTPALRPVYVGIDAAGQYWTSSYWPVYSAIRAVFVLANAEAMLNPLLAALSVVLVYACARRMQPNDGSGAWIAAAFLASSSQFVFMSMTAFSMPAHLCFTLAWLYAFLRGDRAGWIAVPIIGVLALGLHNPFPHALFAAPFLLQFLLRKRWGWTAYFAAVYGVGVLCWLAWMVTLQAPLTGPVPVHELFATPGFEMFLTQGLSFSIFLTWQTPLLAVVLIWTMLAWRWLSGTDRCLIAGVLLSFVFHTFLYTSQGHGWGYRYAYATVGSVALLGASGMARLRDALGGVVMRRLLIASLLLTAAVQVPVRAWQIEGYVRPFARLHDYVSRIDADVVIVDPKSSWYGVDLIRNDPFLQQRPKILSAYHLHPRATRTLLERYGNRVHLLATSEVAQFGLPTFPSKHEEPVWPPRYASSPTDR